jgi:hypothetical protein
MCIGASSTGDNHQLGLIVETKPAEVDQELNEATEKQEKKAEAEPQKVYVEFYNVRDFVEEMQLEPEISLPRTLQIDAVVGETSTRRRRVQGIRSLHGTPRFREETSFERGNAVQDAK